MTASPKIRVGLMSYAFDNRAAKGTAVYARQLTERLVEDPRLDVTLIHYEKTDDPIYQKAKEILMPHTWYPSRFLRQLFFFWQYRKQPFDIIHWFQPRAYPGYWWAPAAQKIITIHGGGKYYYPRWNISARMFHLVIRFLNKWFAALIVASHFSQKESVETYHIAKERLPVIYHGGGERYQALDRADSFAKVIAAHPQITRSFILTVSRLQPHKNINALIRAYDILRAEHPERTELLVIVAKPAESYEETYALAAASRYCDDIVFVDYVETSLLNAMYAAADLFVFPSLSEGFGLPLIEAMSSGTPVVTSAVSCLPEIVDDAGILVNPRDPADIASGMHRVLGDESLQRKCRTRGLLRARQFVWEESAKETVRVYERALAL